MYRLSIIALLGIAMAGMPMLMGCDDQAVKKQDTVEKKADGTTVEQHKKTTTDLDTGESTTKTETKTDK